MIRSFSSWKHNIRPSHYLVNLAGVDVYYYEVFELPLMIHRTSIHVQNSLLYRWVALQRFTLWYIHNNDVFTRVISSRLLKWNEPIYNSEIVTSKPAPWASCIRRNHSDLSWVCCHHILNSAFLKSSSRGLPLYLIPPGCLHITYLGNLSSDIRSTCPNHLFYLS